MYNWNHFSTTIFFDVFIIVYSFISIDVNAKRFLSDKIMRTNCSWSWKSGKMCVHYGISMKFRNIMQSTDIVWWFNHSGNFTLNILIGWLFLMYEWISVNRNNTPRTLINKKLVSDFSTSNNIIKYTIFNHKKMTA